MAKNIEVDAPVAEQTPTVVTTTVTRPRTGLLVGGIVGGAVLVGGLLFGGGVVVGLNIHGGHGGPNFSQGQLGEHQFDRGDMHGGPGQLPQFGGGGQQGPGQLQGPGGDRPIQPPADGPGDGDADNG